MFLTIAQDKIVQELTRCDGQSVLLLFRTIADADMYHADYWYAQAESLCANGLTKWGERLASQDGGYGICNFSLWLTDAGRDAAKRYAELAKIGK